MKNSIKYLCILILTCYSDAQWNQSRNTFEENEKIDILQNCSMHSTRWEKYVTCSDFTMALNHFSNEQEYTTKINCAGNYLPNNYLRNANSNRNSLELKNCELPQSGSFGEGWTRLEYLTISNYRDDFRPLKREHFSGLNNVWHFKLRTNSTQDMPSDLFADLPKLRIIKMSVMYANKKTFSNLNELESLDITILSQESLDNFDTGELKSALKFKELNVSFNNFTRLTKRFFEGCSNIEHLFLSYNTIGTIDFDAFEPLTNVKNIQMEYNKITSLPAGLFSKNKNLEKVEILSLKDLSPIPPGLLSNLSNLREVIIRCSLTSIPNDLLHGSNNLEILDLQYNQLTSIPRDFVQNLSKLKLVKLFMNKFSAFPNDYFYDKSPLTDLPVAREYL